MINVGLGEEKKSKISLSFGWLVGYIAEGVGYVQMAEAWNGAK